MSGGEAGREGDLRQAIDEVTSRAATLEDALRGAIGKICARTGWQAGRVQFAEQAGDEASRVVWHLDAPDQLDTLRELAELKRGGAGSALTLRVLETGEAASEPPGEGKAAAFAFPVVLRKRTVAALELYGLSPEPPPPAVLQEVADVCRALGEVIERKPAEGSLRRAERDYRDLFESAGEALIVTDAELRTVLDANPRACELFGWPFPELVGRDLRSLWQKTPPALGDDPSVRFETQQKRRDGVVVRIEITASPVRWKARPAALLLARELPERELVLEALRASADRDRQLFDKSPQPMWVHDAGTLRILAVNDAALRSYGYPRSELLGMRISDLRAPGGESGWEVSVPEEGEASWTAHAQRHTSKSGEVRDVEFASHEIAYEGRRARLVAVTDVTRRRAAQQRLLHAAFYDALTGLPNRALFKERLEIAHARLRGGGSAPFAVLFLDLDRFKVVNDSLGHEAGDDLLVQIARRLEASRRKSDTVARLGGDEFTVLAEGVSSEAEAILVAERFHRALAQPFHVRGHEIFARISVGIALAAASTDRPESLLREADTAMYRAKVSGVRQAVFDRSMQEHALASLRLETELRHAAERGELRLHFQPIVELPSGRVTGVEALVRWQHPERGLLLPGAFLAMAEQTGAILDLGRWIIGEACSQAMRLPPGVTLGVNLSGHQLLQPDLVEQVETALGRSGFPAERLLLELTESTLIDSGDAVGERLEDLRRLGSRICIDDFGTGYSSLSYLHELPIDGLKIAAPFISALASDPRKVAIVKSILVLGETLSMDVVAEGIETPEQARLLTELGCPRAQGFWFARPSPMEALAF